MGGQDDVDTAKVVIRENTRSEFQSVVLGSGARVELQITVSEAMTGAVLSMQLDVKNADVVVEQIAVGQFVIVPGPLPASSWQDGKIMKGTVSQKNPLRILFVNRDPRAVKVSANLVMNEKPGVYSLVNKG